MSVLHLVKSQPVERRKQAFTKTPRGHKPRRVFDVLFDKLGWWNEIVEIISNENQIKLERVCVRMPRH